MPWITHAAHKLPGGLFALALLPLLLYFTPERGVSSNADAQKGHPVMGQLLFDSFDSKYFSLAGIIGCRMEKYTKECFIVP